MMQFLPGVLPGGCRALQPVQACLDGQLDLHAACCGCRRLKAYWNVDKLTVQLSCKPWREYGVYKVRKFRKRP